MAQGAYVCSERDDVVEDIATNNVGVARRCERARHGHVVLPDARRHFFRRQRHGILYLGVADGNSLAQAHDPCHQRDDKWNESE